MSHFIGVYDNLASDDYCDRVIERYEQIAEGCSGRRGEDDNGGVLIRKDVAFYFHIDAIDLAIETGSILDSALDMYSDEYPSVAMNSMYSNIVKVQKTEPKGGFHQWHSEQGGDPSTSSRCLTWMIYLNDTPEGEGTTEFIEQGLQVQPKKGTVVLFPAAWTHTHRGNPVYTCNKYIATGWYYLS